MRVPLASAVTLWAALTSAGPLAARERFQCSIETQAAAAILDLRDRGQPKSFVLAPLPAQEPAFNDRKGSLQARLVVQMHSIIEDVYAYPDVETATYVAYRMATCTERNAGRKVPLAFSEVALPMSGCQQKHGDQASAALTRCVDEALRYYQGKDATPPR